MTSLSVPSKQKLALRKAARLQAAEPSNPAESHRTLHPPMGVVPDIMEFVVSDSYLDRPNLYPRQATMLKVLFLAKEQMTEYDYQVIGEWEDTFASTGYEGCAPKLLDRIDTCIAQGRSWFRETLAVIGRRGSKNYLGGIAGAYVLWSYMHRPGGPQRYYGIDRDKRLTAIVFAGKKEQARDNQWRDLVNVIIGAPCFAKYVKTPVLSEQLLIRAPSDAERGRQLRERGLDVDDIPSFEIVPSASTMMAGRGSATFYLAFDEMAHIVASGSNRSSDEIYASATPSLDQFGVDAFLYEPSSPWGKTGQFFANWEKAIQLETDGSPAYPEMCMFQLPSWGPYVDWQIAASKPLSTPAVRRIELPNGVVVQNTKPSVNFRPINRPIQVFDDQMRQLERANPETFAVERRARWAQSLHQYLNTEKVAEVFEPWRGENDTIVTHGALGTFYLAHGDPSSVGARFGWALGHRVSIGEQIDHVVIDMIRCWEPGDYEDHLLDYDDVMGDIETDVRNFVPEHVSFDQFNVPATIGRLRKFVARADLPKHVTVTEVTRTRSVNWSHYELFKAAINMGLVHAPMLRADGEVHYASEIAELEMRFLEVKCYDDQTEVLTEHGWMLFRDVADGIRVATRSVDGALEWQAPLARVDSSYDGDLCSYRAGGLDFAVTPNHRMLVAAAGRCSRERVVQAQDLTAQRYSIPVTHRRDESGADGGVVVLGTRWPEPGDLVFPRGRFYNSEEESLLRSHYSTVPTSHLSKVLGRSASSIENKAHKMGLWKRVRWGTRPLEASTEDFAAFVGMWLADGSKTRQGHDVEITQVKPEGVRWIDGLMDRLGWEYRKTPRNGRSGFVWRIASHDLNCYLKALVGPTGLRLPNETFRSWGPQTRQALLDGLLAGDGCWDRRECRFVGFIAENKSLVDDVHHLLVTLGVNARLTLLERKRPNKDMWYLRLKVKPRLHLETSRIERVPYRGRVYCFTVPNGMLMVRRGGRAMWCGNSGAVVHPTSGPVQRKDTVDSICEVVVGLIGRQLASLLGAELSDISLSGSAPRGSSDPFRTAQDNPSDAAARLGALTNSRGRADAGGGYDPSRGFRGRR